MMPLDNQKPINNNFNISAEQNLQNKMKSYNLTKDEKQMILETATKRENDIQKVKQAYNDKGTHSQMVKAEHDKLRAEQKPAPQRHLVPKGAPTMENSQSLKIKAQRNVQLNYLNTVKNIREKSDARINQIFDNAKEDGRGPKSHLQQQFQKAHDHDHNHNR
jgi:hypothetical protein